MTNRPAALALILAALSSAIVCAPVGPSHAQAPTASSLFLMETVEDKLKTVPGCDPQPPNHQSFDIAVVRFSEDAKFEDKHQLVAAQECIRLAKRRNPNGVIMVLFVHGWRHNAAWDLPTGERDDHLREFQKILLRLSLRESERYGPSSGGRRVLGVYLGWPGLSYFRLPVLDDVLSFWGRYTKAREIASSDRFQETITALVRTVHDRGEGTAILVGHSMGAMMLDVALTNLLDKMDPLIAPPDVRGCVELWGVRQPEIIPDSVILLNSAASVSISDELLNGLRGRVRKRVSCGGPPPAAQPFPPYDAPLFVSLTSETDSDTRNWFRIASVLLPKDQGVGLRSERTEGHEDRLITHDLRLTWDTAVGDGQQCDPLAAPDRGQSWHCLREPVVDFSGALAQVSIDLPRQVDPRDPCHDRYVLTRRAMHPAQQGEPFWIVRVPGAAIDGHGDIFNERAGLLTMAFVQLSGSIMSLAQDYGDTFEDEQGPCQPR